MTALDALLTGPRAQRAFVLKAVFAGTWSITVEDRAPLTVVVIASGRATFTDAGGARDVVAGDVILVRGPAPYVVADSAATPQDIRILPDQVCVDPSGALLAETMSLGVRTWGNTRDADGTVMLIGTYERETSVGSFLLSRLSPSQVLHGFDQALVEMLARELVSNVAGQTTVLDRILDLVTLTAVRRILANSPSLPPDAAVAEALRALEERPEDPWTVESIGAHVGLSRAAIARRFSLHVGETPLSYLTRWRLALAADLIVGTDLTLAAIATRVGYANAFAFSAAFKRVRGISPSAFRASESGRLPVAVGH